MQIRTITALALAALLMHASAASAFIYTISSQRVDSLTGAPAADQRIQIDVRLNDAERIGLQLLGAPVMYDPAVLEYEGASSSVPSYILYTPASGATPSVYLYAAQNPPIEWNGIPTAGGPGGQVNLNWLSTGLNPAFTRATDLWIATLQFKVLTVPAGVQSQRDMNAFIVPDFTANGSTLRVDGIQYFDGRMSQVPEPAMFGLALAAVTTLFGIRRARKQ